MAVWQIADVTPVENDIYQLGYMWQRHIFFSKYYWFVFYASGYTTDFEINYKSSQDAINWGEEITLLTNFKNGDNFSLWYENDAVHLVYNYPPLANGNAIYYRKGTVLSGGTISWASPVKVWEGGDPQCGFDPSITRLSNGNIFISFTRRTEGGVPSTGRAVGKYSTDGGSTWLPSGLTNAQVIGPDSQHGSYGIVPLTDSYAIYFYSGANLRAKYWDGSTLGSEETPCSMTFAQYITYVQTSDGKVHLSRDMDHNVRSAGLGGTWSTNSNVHASTNNFVTYTRDGVKVVAYWADVLDLWKRVWNGTSWESPVYLGDVDPDIFWEESAYTNYAIDLEDGMTGIWWVQEVSNAGYEYGIQTGVLSDPLTPCPSGPAIEELCLERVLDWNEIGTETIPRQVNVGEPARDTIVDSAECFVKKPKEIEIICRLTTVERQDLYDLEKDHKWNRLLLDNQFLEYVWLEKIRMKYRHREHLIAPWLATLTLVCSGT